MINRDNINLVNGIKVGFFKESTILVTGGAGFIGHHLCKILLSLNPKRLLMVDNLSSGKEENMISLLANENFEFLKKDILHLNKEDIPENIDYVFHLAALVSVPLSFQKPELTHTINESGFLRILELVKETGVKKVIYASSSAVYGEVNKLPIDEDYTLNPQSPYALSKLVNEKYARSYYEWFGLSSIGFRFFNVYGSGQDASSPYSGAISLFISKMKRNERINIFGDGQQIRDFVHVEDVVNALIKGAISEVEFGLYNVGSGVPTSINELFNMLKQVCNYELDAYYLPARKGDIKKSLSSVSKIRHELGYQPTIDLFSGLNQLFNELIH